MPLRRPPSEPPAGAPPLESFLPKGKCRRLPDDELSLVVLAIALAVPVRPQHRHLMEDIPQDIALEVLTRRADDPNFLSKFKEIIPWVKRAVDAALMRDRRDAEADPELAARAAAALHPTRTETDPSAKVDTEEFYAVVSRAIAAMSRARRQPLQLIRWEHYTRRQVAELLGNAESTVKNNLTDALKELHQAIQAYRDSVNEKEPQR